MKFCRIDIHKTKTIRKMVEDWNYEFGTFISDLGGIIGFYVGASIWMFLEFFISLVESFMAKRNKII